MRVLQQGNRLFGPAFRFADPDPPTLREDGTSFEVFAANRASRGGDAAAFLFGWLLEPEPVFNIENQALDFQLMGLRLGTHCETPLEERASGAVVVARQRLASAGLEGRHRFSP